MAEDTTIPGRWLEAEARFIAAHHHPALLIELALERGARSHRLLRHTGLFLEDIRRGTAVISPVQYRRLIQNACQTERAHELSFLWGSKLFPGHYGAVSTLIHNAADLSNMLTTLTRFTPLLSPLLTPRVKLDERWCYLYWIDGIGAGNTRPFLAEAMMSGVARATRWLSGEKLPWEFAFRIDPPRHREQYDVAFGTGVHFAAGIDLMRIERSWLNRRWPGASAMVASAARAEAQKQLASLPGRIGFIEYLYRYLARRIERPIGLEQASAACGMSAATFKRRLAGHGTGFRAVSDEVRLHHALYLLHVRGWSNERVSAHIGCRDQSNFRRLFRRWTGVTPSAHREALPCP